MDIHNYTTAHIDLKPELSVTLNQGCTSFKARNLTTGEELSLSELPPAGCSFVIDNENEIITAYDGTDLYKGFNYQFFSLARGNNKLEFICDGEVTMSGTFMYNVGA